MVAAPFASQMTMSLLSNGKTNSPSETRLLTEYCRKYSRCLRRGSRSADAAGIDRPVRLLIEQIFKVSWFRKSLAPRLSLPLES
jgi:hypothetical protein